MSESSSHRFGSAQPGFGRVNEASSLKANSLPGVGRLLRAFGSARARRQMTAETTLIYLAVGQMGLGRSGSVVTQRPVTYLDISLLLKIPKETVRRKAARLVDLDLIKATPQGVMLRSVEEWVAMVDGMTKAE